jgi:hypothetical protein
MQTRHSDIDDAFNPGSHPFRGKRGFFRYRQIGCPCAHNRNVADRFAIVISAKRHRARQFMMRCARMSLAECTRLVQIHARNEKRLPGIDHRRRDLYHLNRRFTFRKDHLRQTAAPYAIEVQTRIGKVDYGTAGGNESLRLLGRKLARLNAAQNF